jgi:hypothetical protein
MTARASGGIVATSFAEAAVNVFEVGHGRDTSAAILAVLMHTWRLNGSPQIRPKDLGLRCESAGRSVGRAGLEPATDGL